MITAYFTTADFAAKNAEVLQRFRKALFEAGAYANAHPREMVPVIDAVFPPGT